MLRLVKSGYGLKKHNLFRILTAVVVIALAAGFLFVPVFVSSESGRRAILARVNNSVAGRIDFAGLSMGWLKGIRVTDFRFNDNKGRIAASARYVDAKPHYVNMLAGDLSADIAVSDGSLKVTAADGRTVELAKVNSRIDLHPVGRQTSFDINAAIAAQGRASQVHADGHVTPSAKTGWSLKKASGEINIEANDLNISSLPPFLSLTGINIEAKGSVSANIKGSIRDGWLENLSGTVSGRDLDVTGQDFKGDWFKSRTLDVTVKLQSRQELINIDRLRVHCDWADADATGVIPTTVGSLAEFAKPDSKYSLKCDFACDLAQAAALMPHTLGLKEGISISSGRLSGNVETITAGGPESSSGKKIYAKADLSGLNGTVNGTPVSLSQPIAAQAQIASLGGETVFDKLQVSSAFCRISGSGNISRFEYSGEFDLEKLQSELGQFVNTGSYRLAGRGSSIGQIKSDSGRIAAVGSSQIKELLISSAKGISASEPATDIDFAIAVDKDRTAVDASSIKVNASLGRIDIKNAVLPLNKKSEKTMSLMLSAENIDLGRLQPFAVLFASFPDKTQMAGTAKGDISVSSQKGVCKVFTDSIVIKNLNVISPGREPLQQEQLSIVFDGEFDTNQKNIAVSRMEIESPQLKISGRFDQTTKDGTASVKGHADCDYEWAAVSTLAAAYMPGGLQLSGRRKDAVSFESRYQAADSGGLLANMNAKAKLGFDKGEYMGLDIGPTEADIKVQGGVLSISPFSTAVNNGRLNFAGGADFKQKPSMFRTPGPLDIIKDVQINDKTTKKLLKYLNPLFANAVNAGGVANFQCEQFAVPLKGGSPKDIEITGTVSMARIRLEASDLLGQILMLMGKGGEQNITIHPTRFVLKDGYLRYDNMQVDIGDSPLNFRGVIGLDESLDMTVTLPVTADGRRVRADDQAAMAERLSLSLRGTVSKPKLDTGRLLQDQLIQEGLKMLLKTKN